jgi:hypothetical protein
MGLLTVLLLAGCSGATPTITDGEPVGSVTFKKSPVAQVQVGFHRPESKERVAFGVTDPEGQFRLFEQDGKPHQLSPGTYLVTAENIGEPTWVLPSKYFDPAKTPLKIEVAEGQRIDIHLP